MAMNATPLVWYPGNTMVVELRSLVDIAGVAVTAATVTCTLKDAAGANLTGETWPFAMPHVSAGTYRGVPSAAIAPPLGACTLEITATVGSTIGYWKVSVVMEHRDD